jgi:hypothetical protein
MYSLTLFVPFIINIGTVSLPGLGICYTIDSILVEIKIIANRSVPDRYIIGVNASSSQPGTFKSSNV